MNARFFRSLFDAYTDYIVCPGGDYGGAYAVDVNGNKLRSCHLDGRSVRAAERAGYITVTTMSDGSRDPRYRCWAWVIRLPGHKGRQDWEYQTAPYGSVYERLANRLARRLHPDAPTRGSGCPMVPVGSSDVYLAAVAAEFPEFNGVRWDEPSGEHAAFVRGTRLGYCYAGDIYRSLNARFERLCESLANAMAVDE